MSAKLPEQRGRSRLLGVGHNGELVDNVTAENRYEVDKKNPWLSVWLFTEDMKMLVKSVFIPNTRERPDVVVYRSHVYEVVSTNRNPPQYRRVMSLNAVDAPPQEQEL